jgi:hypothetical protein
MFGRDGLKRRRLKQQPAQLSPVANGCLVVSGAMHATAAKPVSKAAVPRDLTRRTR